MSKLSIVTPSYTPDYHRCERLCRSIDRFVDSSINHLVIVSKQDLKQFSSLTSSRRQVLLVEEVLPKTYRKLPFFKKWWLDPYLFPVRGWVIQQLVKIGIALKCDSDVLIYMDSDVQIFRRVDKNSFLRGDKVRLFTEFRNAPTPQHIGWQRNAELLLGLPETEFTQDYIGHLISWKRDNVLKLINNIEKVTGRTWYRAIGHQITISEYILYGNFVDRVLGENSRHFLENEKLSLDIWSSDDLSNLMNAKQSIPASILALLIQSNLRLDRQTEEMIFNDLIGRRTDLENVSKRSSGRSLFRQSPSAFS